MENQDDKFIRKLTYFSRYVLKDETTINNCNKTFQMKQGKGLIFCKNLQKSQLFVLAICPDIS